MLWSDLGAEETTVTSEKTWTRLAGEPCPQAPRSRAACPVVAVWKEGIHLQLPSLACVVLRPDLWVWTAY